MRERLRLTRQGISKQFVLQVEGMINKDAKHRSCHFARPKYDKVFYSLDFRTPECFNTSLNYEAATAAIHKSQSSQEYLLQIVKFTQHYCDNRST